MTKGQISLDLLLALVVALIFFSIFNIYSSTLEQQIDDSRLKQEMKTILYGVYATIGTVKTYEVEVNYTSPRLFLGSNSPALSCTIEVETSNPDGDIKVTAGTETVSFTNLDLTGIIMPSDFSCGQTITIEAVP